MQGDPQREVPLGDPRRRGRRGKGKSGRGLRLGKEEGRGTERPRVGSLVKDPETRPFGCSKDRAPRRSRPRPSDYLFFCRREAACGPSSGTKEALRTHVSRDAAAQCGPKPWCEQRYAGGNTEGPRYQQGNTGRRASRQPFRKAFRGLFTSRETGPKRPSGHAGSCSPRSRRLRDFICGVSWGTTVPSVEPANSLKKSHPLPPSSALVHDRLRKMEMALQSDTLKPVSRR